MPREKGSRHLATAGQPGWRSLLRPCKTRDMPDLRALADLAIDLAARAAEVHRGGLGRVQEVATKSSATDMVTEIDRAAERLLVGELRRLRPDDAILGEEETRQDGTSGVRWVIDPLDGTTNYIYGYPAFAVSIGVEV